MNTEFFAYIHNVYIVFYSIMLFSKTQKFKDVWFYFTATLRCFFYHTYQIYLQWRRIYL